MKVSYHCSECNKSWSLVLASAETRTCKSCNRTVYGEKVITKVPPPPPSATSAKKASSPPSTQQPRRWETVPRPVEKPTSEVVPEPTQTEKVPVTVEKVSVDSTPADSKTEPPETKRRKPRTRTAEPKEPAVPSPNTVREYVPIDQRPENQRPKPKFYRFFALNSHNGPGIAGAIAESHDEAVERIILRFLQNVVLLSNRNQRIAELRLKHRPLMREQSPQEFHRVLREQGITVQQYEHMLGPTPPDSLGVWNPQLQHNITEEAANCLKEELMQAPYTEYPMEDCAFYQGAVL